MPAKPVTVLSPPSSQPRMDANQVLRRLSDLCQELQPGDVVPPHQELMQRFGASERAVRWALDELRRQERIVRRRGARTFVADTGIRLKGPDSSGVDIGEQAQATATRTVMAIAIPDHALFDQAMKLLVEQAKIEDLSVMCHLLPEATEEILQLPRLSQEPLGFILFRRELLPLAEKLCATGHRVVLLGTPHTDVTPEVPLVYGDHEQGGYLATKHLIDLGHRRIAFCSFADFQVTLRWQGHRRALREAAKRGLDVEDCFLDIEEMRTWTKNPGLGEAVFRSSVAPTGIAVWNDHEAAMVLGQLNRLGLRVPQDVSLVGYDNLREGQLIYPALTTVHSPVEQQVQMALNLLMRSTPPPPNHHLVLTPTLIQRDSSARVQA